jgi:hypothetical protein
MRPDVMAVHLLKDAPVLQVPVECLVTSLCRTLYPKVLCRVVVVVGALDLVSAPHVAVVGVDTLAWLETVG